MTLAEHNALLEADPLWVARRAAQDEARLRRECTFRQEEASLLRDLAGIGTTVGSAWDLVGTAALCRPALEVLIDHLERPYCDRIREGIARALGVKPARAVVWDRLLALLGREPPSTGAASGMMAAVSGMALAADLPVLIALIGDRALGSPRLFLVRNVMRSKQPQAREALLALRDDPDLRLEIADRLKRSAKR